jgi:RNA polymerase sigma-70 factor (ECF subfamily)
MKPTAARETDRPDGGDAQERFAALLEAHAGILQRIGRTYAFAEPDRQDLLQEIAAQLWRSFPRYDDRMPFSTWMYRVALNVAISWVREDRARRERLSPDAALLEATLADAAAGDMPPELHVLLAEVLSRLPALDRALLLLYLEGEDHATIAGVLGISETNVATKIGRLKHKLETEIST